MGRAFCDQMRFSKRHGHFQVFLELFAGSSRLSTAFRRRGWGCLGVEVLNGPEFDLLDPQVVRRIEGWISSGCIAGVFFAPPCASWSIARHGPLGSHWGPLRDERNPMGISGLDQRSQAKTKHGNRTMQVTVRLARVCDRERIPCIIENPASSRFFAAPLVKSLAELGRSSQTVCDLCQYGSPWRKHTRLLGCNLSFDPGGRFLCCQGRGGVCSATGAKHWQLNNPSRTKLAHVYPWSFAHCVAAHMVQAWRVVGMHAVACRVSNNG